MDATDVTPRLQITAPEKGCGKSVTIDFLELVVYRPDPAANISTAAFFRTVEQFRPTLLIDEVDSFAREDSDIRNVLNSGHHVRGRVKRTVGDNHEVRSFSTFAALAYNHIGELPRVYNTLVDRSITIALVKRLPSEKVERLSGPRRRDEFKDLRRKLKRFANDNMTALANAEPVMPPDVINRLADNWTPLLAIADVAGGDMARARPCRHHAATMRTSRQLDRYCVARRCPRYLRRARDRPDFVGAPDRETVRDPPRPWIEYGKSGKPITQNKLARAAQAVRYRDRRPIRIGRRDAARLLPPSIR